MTDKQADAVERAISVLMSVAIADLVGKNGWGKWEEARDGVTALIHDLTLARSNVGMEAELAECLKSTVRLARAYSHGTGTIFEEAMTKAERLAEHALLSRLPSPPDKE